MMTGAMLLFILNWSLLQASAQSLATDEDIRANAQQILDEPEYRYFEHLDDSAERPESRWGRHSTSLNSDGNGADGPAGPGRKGNDGAAGNGSRKGSRHRPGKESSSSSSDAGGDSGGASNPLGGGFEAIGGIFGLIFHALAYLVLIAVCGLIVYLIIQAILNRESSPAVPLTPLLNLTDPQEEDHAPGELPADAYLAQARELAQQRRYREAIAQLLLGGMSSIERGALIRHRRGLTLRDYLRALRGRSPQYDGFRLLIQLYEPVGFGRRVASFQTFEDALAGYEQAVA
jgi:hypothetical protein